MSERKRYLIMEQASGTSVTLLDTDMLAIETEVGYLDEGESITVRAIRMTEEQFAWLPESAE